MRQKTEKTVPVYPTPSFITEMVNMPPTAPVLLLDQYVHQTIYIILPVASTCAQPKPNSPGWSHTPLGWRKWCVHKKGDGILREGTNTMLDVYH